MTQQPIYLKSSSSDLIVRAFVKITFRYRWYDETLLDYHHIRALTQTRYYFLLSKEISA